MLTKGQKIYMYLSAILAMIIGVVTFVPFRTLPFLANSNNFDNLVTIELVVKLIALPIIVILLSIFANVLKYQEIEDCLDRSKVVNVMSYFPIISYMSALLVFIIHTLSYSYEPLGFNVWAVVIVLLVIYLVFTIIAFHFLSNLILRLDLVGTVVFDCVVFVITVCFALVAWRVDKTYFELFSSNADFSGNGDILLFFLYVLSLISIIILCSRIYRMFKKDNRSIYVNQDMFEKNYEKLVKAEYNRAYNDIMDDFELYFEEHYDEEWTDETVEEKETEEDAVEDEADDESSEAVDENGIALEEEPQEDEVSGDVAVIEPLYEDLLDFASKLGDNIEVIPNPNETSHRLIVGKKLFLIMQKTSNDYRITFAARLNYALSLINKVPGAIVKPSSPKGQNWFKVINKGNLDIDFLKEIIQKSYDFATFDATKGIKPSYEEIVEMATLAGGENVKVSSNYSGTQHRFYYNRKMYLITQRTYNDYRITFLSRTEDAIELINEYPGVVVKPSSPQGDNWFKVTNKGEFEEAFLKEIITKSLETLKELQENQDSIDGTNPQK